MAEELIAEPPKTEIKSDINDAHDVGVKLEEKFGGKESLKKAKDKAAEKKPEVKKEEPIVVDDKKKEIVVDSKKEPELKKEDKKPDPAKDKIIETDAFYDPFSQTKPEVKADHEGKEIKVEAVKATEITAEQLEQNQTFQGYKKDSEILKNLQSNPVFETLVEAVKSGKPVIQALQELAPVDYSYKGETDTEKTEVDRWRAKEYFSKVEGLKGEELENAITEFTSLDEGNAKRRDRNEHIHKLSQMQEKKVLAYKDNIQSSARKEDENITNFQKEVDQFLVSIKEKKQLWGMQLTDAHLKSLEEDTKGFFNKLFDENGKINTQLIFSAAFFKNVQLDKNREIAKSAKSEGALDVLETLHNVDANDNSLNSRKPQGAEKDIETTIEEKYGGTQPKT
jgi:hypothetical protein